MASQRSPMTAAQPDRLDGDLDDVAELAPRAETSMTSLRPWRAAFVALTMLTSVSCALLRGTKATCSWLEVEDVANLVVTGPRRLDPQYDGAQCSGRAGEYRIDRPVFTIEVWNGRSMGSELYVRALGQDGRRLTIRATDFAKVHPSVGTREREYDQLLDLVGLASGRRRPLSFPTTVDIVVFDENGTQLGTQTMRIVQRFGRYYYRD